MRKFIALAAVAAAFAGFTGQAAAAEVDLGGFAKLGAAENGYFLYLDGAASNPSYGAGYVGLREKDSRGADAPDGCYRGDGSPNDTDNDGTEDYNDPDIDGDGIDDDGKAADGSDLDEDGEPGPDGPDPHVDRDGDPDGCASNPTG
jgi:hypothetical protein